jgi:putative peptidoglycan lipid II flippase
MIAASVVMGAAAWCSTYVMHRWLGNGSWAHLADLAVSIPVGLAVFYGACRALRIEELEMATRALAGPIMRRLGK